MIKRYYQYVEDVNAGRVLACEALKKAVARFEADIVKAKKRGAKYYFDEEKADRVIKFIERLVQFEEPFAGVPIHLEPWECFWIAQLYGWRVKKTGVRRFRKFLLFMARKQGKTILASALLLYEILSKPGIEAYSLATKQLVSNKSFKNLERFIRANPEIAERLEIFKSPRSIYVDRTGSVYAPLSSDSDLDGLNPAVAHVDELAAQKTSAAYEVLTSGMGTRSEPLTLITSTAAAGVSSPLIPEYEYAKQVLEGIVDDDTFLGAIYELDKTDHWDDLSVMQKSSPNLGISVKLDYYAAELKQAKTIPTKAVEYKTKYCNLWQSSVDTWIPDKLWTRCRQEKKHPITPEALAAARCVIALDFSTIWDWTAATRYYYLPDLGKYVARHRFYIPEDQVDAKAHLETPNIRDWIERGLVVATPGEVIDYEYLYRDLDQDLARDNVLAITYDPAKAKDFEIQYAQKATIVPFIQKNAFLSPAAKGWEKAIVDGHILDDSPVLRWMISNAINKMNPDSGAYFITKSPVGKARKRIDGVITSLMAHSVLANQVLLDAQPKPPPLDWSKIRY